MLYHHSRTDFDEKEDLMVAYAREMIYPDTICIDF